MKKPANPMKSVGGDIGQGANKIPFNGKVGGGEKRGRTKDEESSILIKKKYEDKRKAEKEKRGRKKCTIGTLDGGRPGQEADVNSKVKRREGEVVTKEHRPAGSLPKMAEVHKRKKGGIR